MEISLKRYSLLIILCSHFAVEAAGMENPSPMLDSLKTKLSLVRDYSADVKISLNVSFIRIPVRTAKVFYKKPDKVRIKSPAFVMLPKKGINFKMQELLEKPHTAVWIKREKKRGVLCEVVKIIPLEDNPEVIVATAWIDRLQNRLIALDANTRENGNFMVHFSYAARPDAYDLPGTLEFTFDVNKMSLPMGITGEFDSEARKPGGKGPEKATLTLKYSQYIVNQGISDAVFKE
jgi:hypothetical protein